MTRSADQVRPSPAATVCGPVKPTGPRSSASSTPCRRRWPATSFLSWAWRATRWLLASTAGRFGTGAEPSRPKVAHEDQSRARRGGPGRGGAGGAARLRPAVRRGPADLGRLEQSDLGAKLTSLKRGGDSGWPSADHQQAAVSTHHYSPLASAGPLTPRARAKAPPSPGCRRYTVITVCRSLWICHPRGGPASLRLWPLVCVTG